MQSMPTPHHIIVHRFITDNYELAEPSPEYGNVNILFRDSRVAILLNNDPLVMIANYTVTDDELVMFTNVSYSDDPQHFEDA